MKQQWKKEHQKFLRMMKNNCLEIYETIGKPHAPLKPVAKGEDILLKFYDASNNEYPDNCVYASSLQEIIDEKNLAQQHKYNNIPVRRMYLWVLNNNQIRVIREATPVNSNRGFACHPNMTEGKNAIIGGELWFLKKESGETEVYLNLDSGRYTARDVPSQFPLVQALFECVGYTIKKLII